MSNNNNNSKKKTCAVKFIIMRTRTTMKKYNPIVELKVK